MRPRRSCLYMPGSNQRALEKARTLPADVLILDLEDAVSPADKALAREQILAALASREYGGDLAQSHAIDKVWSCASMPWTSHISELAQKTQKNQPGIISCLFSCLLVSSFAILFTQLRGCERKELRLMFLIFTTRPCQDFKTPLFSTIIIIKGNKTSIRPAAPKRTTNMSIACFSSALMVSPQL